MQKPLIFLTLAYSSGILLGHGFLYFPYFISSVVIFAGISAALLVLRRKISLGKFLLLVIPALAGGAAYLYSAMWLPSDHYTRLMPEDRAMHFIKGTISSALDRDPGRTGFTLSVKEIDGVRASGKLRATLRSETAAMGFGDMVLLRGKLFVPGGYRNEGGFDYPAYLARSGIHRMVSVKSSGHVEVAVRGTGLFRTIQDWRERIRQAFLASTTGPGSAILQAMVLGEEGMLTDEVRDLFLASGVTHIISISGSHLATVAVVCFALIRLLIRLLPEPQYHWLTIHADPKKVAALLTLPLVVFYTLLAGGQMATVRSLIMITSALSAMILDRENALLNALAAAGLFILLADPQALFDISFQLSFLSVVSIAFVVLLKKELQLKAGGKLANLLHELLLLVAISVSAALATGPLVIRYFSQFSPVSLVSNILVVPVAGFLIVPLGLFSGILSLFVGYLPLAYLNQLCADWFVDLVAFFARLPAAQVHPPSPGMLWLLIYVVLVSSVLSVLRLRMLARFKPFEHSGRVSTSRYATIAFSVLALSVLSFPWPGNRNAAVIAFPDVGQGDSALIQLPGLKSILIDGGGTYDDRFDTGRRILAPFLWKRGVRRLDLVILSHPHPDHMNGLKYILRNFRTAEIWISGLDTGLPGYEDFMVAVTQAGALVKTVSAQDPAFQIGNAELKVIHPSPNFVSRERKAYAAENDRSLVLRVSLPGGVLLFPGDVGAGAEKALVDAGENLKCDVLKVAHHGSKSSSSEPFLSVARPEVAVMTAGNGNRYGHPSPEVVERYAGIGSQILRTDQHGALKIGITPHGIRIVKWDDLELKPAGFDFRQEQENWKRVWLRKWEL